MMNFRLTLNILKSLAAKQGWADKLFKVGKVRRKASFANYYLSTNFGLIAVFVKGTLEITKRAQHCVWLIHMLSWLIEIAQVYLRLVVCRMHKGHVQNEWVIKTFRKHPKGSKFVCTKSSLHFIHNLYLLVEIQRYLESPRIDFCETPYNRIQAPKVYVA